MYVITYSRRNRKLKYIKQLISPVVKMVSYIKEGLQAKGIWKQDPEASIWAEEGWEWEVEKVTPWETS